MTHTVPAGSENKTEKKLLKVFSSHGAKTPEVSVQMFRVIVSSFMYLIYIIYKLILTQTKI